jgi:hypothetical protein
MKRCYQVTKRNNPEMYSVEYHQILFEKWGRKEEAKVI